MPDGGRLAANQALAIGTRGFLSAMPGRGAHSVFAHARTFAQAASAHALPLNLKITGLKTFVVNAVSLHWVFCKFQTNEGLTRLGEGSVTSKDATIAQAIMKRERFLIGKDPADIEFLWQCMFRVLYSGRLPGLCGCRAAILSFKVTAGACWVMGR